MAINIGRVTIGNLWKSHTEVFNLIMRHLNRYPLMEVQDVYTLIYQGAMGATYMLQDVENFEERLIQEFTEAQPDENQTLWETIRPDGQLIRVHIPALKARGGSAQKLATLSLWTTSIVVGNQDDLMDGWETFQKVCAEKRLRQFDRMEIDNVTAWAEKNNYPSTRHTRVYREAYHPHYRLLRREFLQTLLENNQS